VTLRQDQGRGAVAAADAPTQLREAISRRLGSPWTAPTVMTAVGAIALIASIVAAVRGSAVFGGPLALIL